jgi:antirestriction protein
MEIEEYTCLEKLNEITEAMEGIDADGQKAIKFLLDNNFVSDIFQAIENYEDSVRIYEDSTMENIAENYIEECYNLDDMPSIIANNIDYESIARDMEIEGSFYRVDNDIYEYIG